MNFLFQPAYIEFHFRRILVKNAIIGFFVFFFLLVFGPLGLYYWRDPLKIFYLFGFGIVSFLTLSFNDLLVKRSLAFLFKEENWVLWKSLIWEVYQILTVSLFNVLYSNLSILHTVDGWPSAMQMVYVTFMIGIFPAIATLLIFHFKALIKYSTISENLSEVKSNPLMERISLLDEKKRDALEVFPKDVFYLESADNYTIVFFKKEADPGLSKVMIRNTIGHLKTHLTSSEFLRCHRSYVVNLNYVQSISGNAQGIRLHLRETSCTIPVSRTLTKEVLSRVKGRQTIRP